MPYDLFVCTEPTSTMTSTWHYLGTWPKLWLAEAQRHLAGQQRPELRRWSLFYVRRTTAAKGILHSSGDYERKETPHA